MTDAPSRVTCPLRAAALTSPDAPAVVHADGFVSFAELDAGVSAAEERVASIGLSAGDRVALYLAKDRRYLVLLWAFMRAGIVACPLSTRLPPDGVALLLEAAGCSALVSNDQGPAGAASTARRVQPEVLVAEDAGDLVRPAEPCDVPLDRPATVVFTSGSTGVPKGALHTFGNHYFSALGSNTNIALAPGDRWLHSLPLYHVGGLSIIFRCLLAGATIALPARDAKLGASVRGFGATHVSLVATQLRRLLRDNADLGRLAAVLLGGGPVPEGLVDEALSRNLPIHTSYGLTEMASQVTTTPPGASGEQLRTAGRVLPHREVGVSEGGEILVRGRTLFAGYVGDGGRPLDAEGWFHTGDRGALDKKGNLRVTGRLDNLFVSGGENVQPEEIEAALGRVAGVEEVVVVPVPDPEFGEKPVAFVRGTGEEGDLARALELVLPRFKIPRTFHEWEGTGGMKPDRAALKERAARLQAQDG